MNRRILAGTNHAGFPPAFAKAFGFTKVAFFDHFTSPATIDLGNTNAPGYKWYIDSGHTGNIGQISAANSILKYTLVGSPADSGTGIRTAQNVAGGGPGIRNHGSVGKLFSGTDGYYFEWKIRYTGIASAGNNERAALWTSDYLNWMCGQVAQISTALRHGEVNPFDTYLPTQDNEPAYLDWTATYPQVATIVGPSNSGVQYNDLDWSKWHTWGILMVPSGKNSGVGLMRFYTDRVQRGPDYTWSAYPASGSAAEVSHQFVMIGADVPPDFEVDYVAVANSGAGWDGPTSGLTHRWSMRDADVVSTSIKDVVGTLHGTAGSGISSTIGALCNTARLGNGVVAQGYITLPSSPIADLTAAWTIAGKIRMISPSTGGGGGANIRVCQFDDGTHQLSLVVTHGGTPGQLALIREGGVWKFTTTAAMFDAGVFRDFAVVFNGTTYTVYQDALSVATGGSSVTGTPSTGNCILAQSATDDNCLNGSVDQFVTYNRALTAAEVATLQNAYEDEGTVTVSTSYSAQSSQFFSRITDPGTTRKNLYAALIDGIFNDGNWTGIDALWIESANALGNALVNLKSSSFGLTVVGSMTFTADQGFSSDGTTNSYIKTGFNPGTSGGSFSLNSATMGCYCLTSNTTAGWYASMGCSDATNNDFIWPVVLAGQLASGLNEHTGTSGQTNTNFQGQYIVSRTSASLTTSYKNGASLGTSSIASVALASAEMYLFARNANGTVMEPFPAGNKIAAHFVGGGLNSTQALAVMSRINNFMAGLPTPVNVY